MRGLWLRFLLVLLLFPYHNYYGQGLYYYNYSNNLTLTNKFNFSRKAGYFRTQADSQSVLTKLGQWGWGPCDGVAVKGHYAFIGNGAMLQVLDVSDPKNPKAVGQLLTNGPVGDVIISGNYAYTLKPLRIIDISNPTLPRLLSTFSPSPVPLTTIFIQGDYVYAGNMSGAIYIIDVSNPDEPKVVNPPASIVTSGEIVESIVISGNYLYASSYDGHSLDIYDVSNPAHPISVSHPFNLGGATALTVSGKYLYMGTPSQFKIYDLNNPTNPRLISQMNLGTDTAGSWTYAISVANNLAYLSTGAGFKVVDIADTSNLQTIAELNRYIDPSSGESIKFGAGSQYITQNYACLTTGDGLLIVNITPPSLKMESFFGTGLEAMKIATDSSNHAFIAELSGGLKIVDFSEPYSPHLIGQYNPDESVRDVAVKNGFAYLLCDSNLLILNISNLPTPKLIGKITFADTITDKSVAIASFLCVDGQTVYVARKSKRLFTINVADPAHPTITSIISLGGLPMGMAIFDNYLYVACGGVWIFDVSDPFNPKNDGLLRISTSTLITSNGKLFVAGLASEGFSEYGLSTPLSPILKYTISIPGAISFVKIATDKYFAYVSTGQYLVAIDISNPDSGKIIAVMNADSLAKLNFPTVALLNGLILLSVGDQGIIILYNMNDSLNRHPPPPPKNFKLFQNYPNPFNPGTKIMFQVNVASQLTLYIYNILGDRMFKKYLGTFQIGTYKEFLDMHKFASGIYIYGVEAITTDRERIFLTKKMVLLK